MSGGTLITVSGLRVWVGATPAVRGVNFVVDSGTRLGLVGESGSGKTLTALALSGLLPDGVAATGTVSFENRNLIALSEKEIAPIRGRRIATIFQDPLKSLNPVMRVGAQVAEMFRLHTNIGRRDAWRAATELIERVGLPEPGAKARAYPHQLSGGQRQRVVIAMAIACRPSLLIADEPTTALDATVQLEILRLLDALVHESGTALLLISHDLAVVSNVCERVLVMYGGKIVEQGPTESVLAGPRHRYTEGLMRALPTSPSEGRRTARLPVIAGAVPPIGEFPEGCGFRSRCAHATDQCKTQPVMSDDSHSFACWNPVEVDQ